MNRAKSVNGKHEATFLICIVIILLVAFFMRFYKLDIKPLHFDEGTHWYFFINKIYHGEVLRYFSDFHGFTSWYLSSLPLFFKGLSVFTLRFMVAFVGGLTIALVFLLKKEVGRLGIIVTSFFMAISPSLVYYSRVTSQYPYIIFFMLSSFVSVVYYCREFREIYLYLFAVIYALLLTTHEISLIYLGVLIPFIGMIYFFNMSSSKIKPKMKIFFKSTSFKTKISAVALFIIVVSAIMSNFFTNWECFFSFLRGIFLQIDKFSSTGHNKTIYYYIAIFYPIDIFAFLGIFFSLFFLRRNYFSLLVFYYTFASLLIFFMIPYKIPQMFTLVLLPMYLLSGLTVEGIYIKIKNKKNLKAIFFCLLIILFIFTFHKSVKLNYFLYAAKSDDNPLNYVGPVEDNYRLLSDLQSYLKGKNSTIFMVGTDLWPLPYYLRKYRIFHVGKDTVLNVYYNDYDMFVVPDDKAYDNKILHELGIYELRENYYIKILVKKTDGDKNK